MKIFVTNKKKNESLGADITDFQRWVDYDMKHYKRISDKTMEAIKEAGLSVVKDQYGDYEVIADAKVESCGKKIKESEEETVVFRKLPEDRSVDFEDEVGDVALARIVITDNDRLSSFGKKELLDIVNDSETEAEAIERLEEKTGKKYDVREMRGYTQGEWNNIYYPIEDESAIDYIEAIYTGKYDIFANADNEWYVVPHDIAWDGSEKIKEYLSEKSGVEKDKIVLKKTVRKYYDDEEDFDESCKTKPCKKTDRKSVKENRNNNSDDISADEI